MTWIYLDDRFPEHPKVVAAGGDAAWLFITALAWSNRHNTLGAIPRAVLSRLSDRKSPTKLAAILVRVRLFEVTDGGWQIHDYEDWNRSAQERSDKARHAANRRWEEAARRKALAMLEHMPEHPSSIANAYADAMPSPNPYPNTLVVLETHEDIHNPVDDDDQAGIVEAALRTLASRDLMRREGEVGPVGDREAWFKRAVEARRERHAAAIADALGAFSWRPDKLADFLEPPLKSSEGPLEATAAAQAAIIERNEQRRQEAPR